MSDHKMHYSELWARELRERGSYFHAYTEWPPAPENIGDEHFAIVFNETWQWGVDLLENPENWTVLQAQEAWLIRQLEEIRQIIKNAARNELGDDLQEQLSHHPGVIVGIENELAERLAYHFAVFGLRLRVLRRIMRRYMTMTNAATDTVQTGTASSWEEEKAALLLDFSRPNKKQKFHPEVEIEAAKMFNRLTLKDRMEVKDAEPLVLDWLSENADDGRSASLSTIYTWISKHELHGKY